MKARGLRVGERVFYAGTGWQVTGQTRDGSFILRHTGGEREDAVIAKSERVWAREPSRFERQRPPGQPVKGKHAHQWRLLADGQGRLCTVCGRGDVKTDRGWRRAT